MTVPMKDGGEREAVLAILLAENAESVTKARNGKSGGSRFASDRISAVLDAGTAGGNAKDGKSGKDVKGGSRPFTQQQKAFIRYLAEGCIGDREKLDAVIGQFSRKKAGSMAPVIRAVLHMGIWQILYTDSVPDAVACSESVELAKRHGFSSLSGFVNGLLRNVARNRDDVLRKLNGGGAGTRYALPDWIHGLWIAQYGAARAGRTAAAMEKIRPLSIRFRAGLPGARQEEILGTLEKRGVKIRRHPYIPVCVELRGAGKVTELPGFAEGAFTVQDPASMLPALAAGIRGGETILDLCAAPGGKAVQMAELLAAAGKGGAVRAFDLYSGKVRRIEENAARMRVTEYVSAAVRDASVYQSDLAESADIVLCDVPCSGLGVLGRKREIRYRIKPDDLSALRNLQRAILSNAVRYAKSGALLLYSTCTIDRLENDDNADWLRRKHGLVPVPLAPRLPAGLPGLSEDAASLQLFPDVHETDGFFIAAFRKPL